MLILLPEQDLSKSVSLTAQQVPSELPGVLQGWMHRTEEFTFTCIWTQRGLKLNFSPCSALALLLLWYLYAVLSQGPRGASALPTQLFPNDGFFFFLHFLRNKYEHFS